MTWYLFLDSTRIPKDNVEWTICRSSNEALYYARLRGLPKFMSLDYDLGAYKGIADNTMIFLDQLNNIIWDKTSEPPMYRIHSDNLSEIMEIESYMDDWFRTWTPVFEKGK